MEEPGLFLTFFLQFFLSQVVTRYKHQDNVNCKRALVTLPVIGYDDIGYQGHGDGAEQNLQCFVPLAEMDTPHPVHGHGFVQRIKGCPRNGSHHPHGNEHYKLPPVVVGIVKGTEAD